MVIELGFNEKKVGEIARECGSPAVKKSVSFLGRMAYYNPGKLVCEIIDGVAFWGGCLCKNHLRLYEIAVKESAQGKGYGRIMIMRIKAICRESGLKKITFRTSKEESAINFYKKMGAVIVGEKGNDWEVEIIV